MQGKFYDYSEGTQLQSGEWVPSVFDGEVVDLYGDPNNLPGDLIYTEQWVKPEFWKKLVSLDVV